MKSLGSGDYTVIPFKVSKTHLYTATFLSTSFSDKVTIDAAVKPMSTWLFTTVENEPINSDGIYKRPLYSSVQNLFYGSGSSNSNNFLPTGSTFYVCNIAQRSFGEGILPRSLTISSPSSTSSFFDGGDGCVYSTENTSSIIGNIFYKLGIIVLQQMITTGSVTGSVLDQTGVYLTTGSQILVEFDSTHTIYEYKVICTMNEYDFNYSTNPSMQLPSSSVSGSTKIFDLMASGTLDPYMTSIGLYTSNGELVALGKFPSPVKRAIGTDQTIIIRFDS